MKNYMRSLLATLVCLFVGIQAQAQFTGTVTQYPTTNYANSPATFSLTEVAKALDTEAATLADTFNQWQEAEAWEGENLFWLIGGDGTATDEPTADGKGFWMTTDGERIAYGEGAVWFAFGVADAEADVFNINCGQMPNAMQPGDKGKAKFQLRFNGKTADFEIELSVIAKPTYDIPEPTLTWKELDIVAELTVDTDLKLRGTAKPEVNLTEALAKLGIESMDFVADELENLLYATQYYLTDDVALGGMKSDTLTNTSTAYAPGFWLCAVSDSEGNQTNECCAAPYDGSDHFYVQLFSFNAESGVMSCELGQMANNLKEGQQYYTYLYIVYGNKAISIRYNLNVIESNLGTLEDYEKAGEKTIEVEMEAKTDGDYSTKDFTIGIDDIVAALGCEKSEIEFWACRDDITFTDKNQEGVGYWFNREGYVVDWGETAMAYVTPTEDDWSKFGIGQYPGHLTVGDEMTASLYFLGNGKYYKLSVHLTVVEKKIVEGGFQNVAQRSYSVQQTPKAYVWTSAEGMTHEIPEAWIEENIGTSDWVVYGLDALNEDGTEKEGNAKYTKTYTCTPYPGFWLSADGRNNGWNANARIGITAKAPEGGFALMQYEGDVCQIGDVFKTQLFFVNEENGKMVTFNFTFSIVAEVIEAEVVGTEELVLPVSDKDASIAIDLTKASEALGVSVEELINGKYLCGMTEGGVYSGASSGEEGLGFNKEGFFDMANGPIFISLEYTDGVSTIVTFNNEAVADDFNLSVQMCFQADNKQYVYNVKFVAPSVYTGIKDVHAPVDGRIYDLSGRQVRKPAHGLYIVGGKKVIIAK